MSVENDRSRNVPLNPWYYVYPVQRSNSFLAQIFENPKYYLRLGTLNYLTQTQTQTHSPTP